MAADDWLPARARVASVGRQRQLAPSRYTLAGLTNEMNDSEAFVDRRLLSFGLRPEPFSKEEMRARKTPDRRVYRDRALLFLLEVKEVAADEWLGGERSDPRFNRLSADVHEAVKQFDSVNPDRQLPNVLAFVNRDSMCDSRDLLGVLTGYALTTEGEKLALYEKYSLGRIREERFRVDTYLWLEETGTSQVFLNDADTRHSSHLWSEFKAIVDGLTG